MTYNPAGIEGKRPKGGEVWVRRYEDGEIVWAKVIARRTISTLLALGRRSKLADCEDRSSMIAYFTPEDHFGMMYEKEFIEAYPIYLGTMKALTGRDIR